MLLAASVMLSANASAKSFIKNLKVEYAQQPQAVSVLHPRFAWQMTSDDTFRGWKQSAYRISVVDESGKEVWNSGKVTSSQSLNILYEGEKLKPATRYQWNLKVWNQKNELMTENSFFETALMMTNDNGQEAWDGAKWIGKSGDAKLYAQLAEQRRAFFQKTYLDAATQKTIFSGFEPEKKGQLVPPQASYALPLA